jgi:sodium/hydrogen antiporter
MDELQIVLVIVGALTLTLGVWSNYLRRQTFVPEPFVALLTGVLLGPSALDLLDPGAWGDERTIVKEAARITLAVALMAIALRLPPDYLQRHGRATLVMVALVMPLTFLVTGAVSMALLGLPLLAALALAAVLTPTDPVVTTTIMVGDFAEERLPERIRNLLSIEAGANDGLAVPFVMLPVLLLTLPSGEAWGTWFLRSWLWEIGGGLVAGAAIGFAAGRMLTWSEERGFIERHSFLAFSLALTLLTLGIAEGLGMEGLFAVFLAGLTFSHEVGGTERAEEEGVQEAISQFIYLPAFALFGLVLPWEAWSALPPAALGFVLAVLALRRLPVVVLVARGLRSLPRLRDRLYVGWFGPIGLSSVLLALIAWERSGLEAVWVYGSLMVAVSAAVHGVSANPLTRRYDRGQAGDGQGDNGQGDDGRREGA